jgi:hypothetical protein
MALWLKQSTAVSIAIGPFVDSTDGVTAETGLTLSQADVRLKKNAGNWAQANESTSATHEENGWYEKPLDATDTNTLGILVVAIAESGALPVWRDFLVVPAETYDTLVGGSDNLTVDLTAAAKTAVNAEVVDCLATDTYAEPSAVPAATATLEDKISWMAALARNKITQTATTQTLRNDADSGNIATSTTSDDGSTFTRSEFV